MKELLQFFRDVLDEFTDIIKEIIKPRTFFAFMFYATFCYLIFKEKPIPDPLKSIVDMLLGYWFGSRIATTKEETKQENKDAKSIP